MFSSKTYSLSALKKVLAERKELGNSLNYPLRYPLYTLVDLTAEGGDLIGYAVLSDCSTTGVKLKKKGRDFRLWTVRWYLEQITILPDFEKQGYGKKLMKYLTDNFTGGILLMAVDNTVPFYLCCGGIRVTSYIRFLYTDGYVLFLDNPKDASRVLSGFTTISKEVMNASKL